MAAEPVSAPRQIIVAVGEWWTDFECTECRDRYVLAPEDELGFVHKCKTPSKEPEAATNE